MRRHANWVFALILLAGCGGADESWDPADGDKADKAPGQWTVEVESGGTTYTLELQERADQSALDVQAGDWRFVVPWDGMTYRCRCRGYASALFDIYIETMMDEEEGPRIEVHRARLGLSAVLEDSVKHPGQKEIKLSDGTFPTFADLLTLLETMSDDERALIDKIAETDLEAYLLSRSTEYDRFSKRFVIWWDNEAELDFIAELLTIRVYQPYAAEQTVGS